MPRVLIVSDELLTRQGLRKLFEEECVFEICGEAENDVAALELTESLSPSLIVLDAVEGLPKALIQELLEMVPETPIFLLMEESSVAIEKAALASGVTAVFSKLDDLEALAANARAITQK
ncbi:MAG TPA: response regulator [Candidatus Acidoferrum sp.]|nr:response regulator [Candidatus Acidoferrum sp.]